MNCAYSANLRCKSRDVHIFIILKNIMDIALLASIFLRVSRSDIMFVKSLGPRSGNDGVPCAERVL
ncbi:hypothetical protein CWC46_19360 [Prodigiosinella confusarubida]|uniref:Uncharacterized protein n=1 Tax=Serratia sp. (strain ATCC 39006) TaxID=104623 RepID=A0A2I5TNF5_SERS3|nr:hypothetical protein CWC46_19360 [Serratia sp. ATCC 39006]AUH06094.1 hypothetical protein Ser39006_019360 [Serratia sp. ATCC 39006]